MSELNLKLIYQLIENKFGISQSEIEKIDKLDGKSDGRINGISLFHYFQNGYNIHNLPSEEIINNISVFMNNNDSIDFSNQNISSNKIFYSAQNENNTKASIDNIVERLINEIHKIGFAKLEEPIAEIDENNVVEVLEKYQKASNKKNSVMGKVFDHESLFEAILDESISDEQKKKYINHIKDALVKRINNLNGDASYTGELFSRALDFAIKKWWPFQNSDKLDKLCNKFIQIIRQLEAMQVAGENVTPAKAKKINGGFIQQLKWMGISAEDLFGNGYFDNDSIQMTGNCWIHAGINSMMLTPAGKEHLNNLVKKSANGNTVVYLPGAKDKHLPKPKGDGIFVYTKKQISDAVKNESAGDGDIAAISLAIRDARRAEQNSTKADSSSGSFNEFCKWIYGNSAESLSLSFGGMISDDDRKCLIDGAEAILKIHELAPDSDYVTAKDVEQAKLTVNYDSPEKISKNLKEIFKSKNYIINVNLTDANYNNLLKGEKLIPDNNKSVHVVSLVSISNDDVYLKDSNDPTRTIKVNIMDLVKCCTIQIFKIN